MAWIVPDNPFFHFHQAWQPKINKRGNGKECEGDAMNSFLRNKNSELIICADCHGADAIFRYKYFHGETLRKNTRFINSINY